jgi:hypothetical protein
MFFTVFTLCAFEERVCKKVIEETRTLDQRLKIVHTVYSYEYFFMGCSMFMR